MEPRHRIAVGGCVVKGLLFVAIVAAAALLLMGVVAAVQGHIVAGVVVVLFGGLLVGASAWVAKHRTRG